MCAQIRIDLAGSAEIASEGREPEHVDINDVGEIAVMLQKDNSFAIISPDGMITSRFSASTVSLDGITRRMTVR